jgi:hypothetical protein
MLVRGGGEHIDVQSVLATLDAYIEAKLKEKNTPAKDKYTSYGLMGGDKFVNEDSLKRNIT